MLKKETRKEGSEYSVPLEQELYEKVEKFFSEKKECKRTGSATSSPISLGIFGGTIYPDVYGIKNPENSNFQIYMGEGKRDLGGRSFDICKGQAISLQRFADYVYLFFARESWTYLSEKEQKEINQECNSLRLGLLLVNKEDCEELVPAIPNAELLQDERKNEVRDLVVQYFPDFLSEANIQFFEQFSELAMNIAGKSHSLLSACGSAFKKQTDTKALFTHVYYGKDKGYFQFAFERELKPACTLYLTVNPFGHFLFENTPLLIIEHWFAFPWYSKKDQTDKLLQYCDKCLRADSKIEVIYVEEENSLVDKMQQLSRLVKNASNHIEEIAIYQPIKISGREITKIVEDVHRSLSKLTGFLKSQRKPARKRVKRS